MSSAKVTSTLLAIQILRTPQFNFNNWVFLLISFQFKGWHCSSPGSPGQKFPSEILADNKRWRCEPLGRDKSSFGFCSEATYDFGGSAFLKAPSSLDDVTIGAGHIPRSVVSAPSRCFHHQLRPPCGTCNLFPIQNVLKEAGTQYFYYTQSGLVVSKLTGLFEYHKKEA